MKTTFLMLATALAIGLVSCADPQSPVQPAADSQPMQTTEATDHHHHEDESDDALQLNDGQKWKVDDSMMVHIRSMEKEVNDFSIAKSTEYGMLSNSLEKKTDLLISSCTMTGEAHDELHKWLLPFIALTKKLGDADTSESGNETIAEIKSSLAEFNEFFE